MAELCYGCMKQKQAGPVCEHCGCDEREPVDPTFRKIGTILQGRYFLGRGTRCLSYASRYIGFDILKRMPVTVLEYFDSADPDQDFDVYRQQLIGKTEQLSRFQFLPGILVASDWFEENGKLYLVEKHIAGENLKQIMERGPMEPGYLLQLLRPVMTALQVIHAEGLYHLNIKPENIILDAQGNAVLKDFKDFVDNDAWIAYYDTIIPHSMIAYRPVEILQSKGVVGPWSDIYSLGAVIYSCLTARYPVPCIERITEGRDLDWYSIPNLSYQQRTALTRGTEVRPKNRTQSMHQLMDDLYGYSFVDVDHHRPDDHPLAGVPVRPMGGAMTYDPPKNWLNKLFKK